MTSRSERPIVVAIPTDDDLETILTYAVAEARLHHCGLHLVHAHQSGDEGHAELVLARAAAMARLLAGPSVKVTTRRVVGAPVEAVLTSSPDASLVVLRSRDSRHLLHFIDRGSSRAVAGPPVACLPRGWSPRLRDPRPVLLATSDPASSVAHLRLGLEVARTRRTGLHVLHAWQLPGRSDELILSQVGPELGAPFHAALQAALERCHYHDDFADMRVDVDVRHGIAAELVLQAARDAQVLLLGRNAPAVDGSLHLGRTTRAALHGGPCPTVLLPSPTAPATGASDAGHEELRTAALA